MQRTSFLALTGFACIAGLTLAAETLTDRLRSRLQEAGVMHVCEQHPKIAVHALARPDAEAACKGASRALDFLASAGLDGPESTTIEIVPELPGELAGRAVGCYVRETKGILLLSFDAFHAGGGWFRLPPSWELYRAAASHEIAHSVVGCHSDPRRLPVAAHEYVAYVVLFATMEPQLRAALLANFPGAGFKTSGHISDINHIVNPNQFGVDSWRHYLRVKDRERWLRQVIAGDVVLDLSGDPDASSR